MSNQPPDTQPDPWAMVERYRPQDRPDGKRTVMHGHPEGEWMRVEDIDTARAQVDAQHAEEVARLTWNLDVTTRERNDVQRQFDGACVDLDTLRAQRSTEDGGTTETPEVVQELRDTRAELSTLRAHLTERDQEREAVVTRLRSILSQVDEALGPDTLIARSCEQMIAALTSEPQA